MATANARLGERAGWRTDGHHLLCDTVIDWAAEDWNDLLLDLSEHASDGTVTVEKADEPPYVYAPRYERGYRPEPEVEGMLTRHGSLRYAHPEPVERVAWSADDHWLAVAITDSFSGHIWVWDLRTDTLAYELTAREGESFGYSSAGIPMGFAGPDRLVALGMDNVLRSWDLATGRLSAWRDCKDAGALGVGPGTVAMPGDDGIQLLRSDTLEVERVLPFWSSSDIAALTVMAGPNGADRLAISRRSQVEILDIATGEQTTDVYVEHRALTTADDTLVFAGRNEEYDENGELVTSYHAQVYSGETLGPAFADGSPIAAIAAGDDAVVLARGKSLEAYAFDGSHLWSHTLPTFVTSLAIRGDTLALGLHNGRLHFLDNYRAPVAIPTTPPKRGVLTTTGHLLDDGRRFNVATGDDDAPLPDGEYVCVSADGDLAIARPEWRELAVVDARSGDGFGERLATIEIPGLGEIQLQGAHLLALDEEERPGMFDVGSGKLIRHLWSEESSSASGLTARADRLLAWNDDEAQLWSLSGQQLQTFAQSVNCGALGADGALYLGSDEQLSRVDPDTGALLWQSPGYVATIVPSPSGRTVIAHNGGTLSVHDATTGERQAALRAHRGLARVGFLPTGSLVTLGTEGTAVVWDVGEPNESRPAAEDRALILDAIDKARTAASLPLTLQVGATWTLASADSEMHLPGDLPDMRLGVRGRLRFPSAERLQAALGFAGRLDSIMQISGLTVGLDGLPNGGSEGDTNDDSNGDTTDDPQTPSPDLAALAAFAEHAAIGAVVARLPGHLCGLRFEAGAPHPSQLSPLAPPGALRRWGALEEFDPDADLTHVGECIWWLNSDGWDSAVLEVRETDFSPRARCDLPAELDVTVAPTGAYAAIQLPDLARHMAQMKGMKDEVGILRMDAQLAELGAIGPRNMNYDDLHFSADGRYLAIEVEDVEEYESWIEIWHWADNRPVVRFDGLFHFLDNDRLVWADSELHLVDLTSGEQLSVTDLNFDIDSIEAASGSDGSPITFLTRMETEVAVWSADDLTLIERRPAELPEFGTQHFTAIAANDRWLATLDSDDVLTVLAHESGEVLLRRRVERERYYDAQLIFLGGAASSQLAILDQCVRILDLETGTWRVSGPCKVTCLARAQEQLLTGHEDGLLRWWGPGAEDRRERVSEGKVAAVASGDGLLWADESGKHHWAGEEFDGTDYYQSCMAVVGDLAAWATSEGIRLGTQTIELPYGAPSCLAFHPSGAWLAVSTSSGLLLFDRDGTRKGQLLGHEESVSHLAFTPDGSRLFSCGGTTLIAWDAAAMGAGHSPDPELAFEEVMGLAEQDDDDDDDDDDRYDDEWE